MKKALAIALTFSIIAQGMVNLALCAYYEWNKKEIAQKLCVNKGKPAMHCDGQCYLGRQLKKAEEHEKHHSPSLREKDEVITLCRATATLHYIPNVRFVGFPARYSEHWLINAPRMVPDQPPRA